MPFTETCDGRASLFATSATASGVTAGFVGSIRCSISVTGCAAASVTLSGSLLVSFNNAASQLTILATGQILTVVSICGIIPGGTAVFSSSSTVAAAIVLGVSPSQTGTSGP